jgi:hypothetical protein
MNVRQVLPRDAIPSVDDPSFVGEYDGDGDDEVVAVTVGGESRAYPLRYLHYHEIVNDRIGRVPIAVTWCPLCGSAVVYDRRVGAGGGVERGDDANGTVDGADRTLEFGVSGKLADDDLVMYDRETGSEWKQSLGRCIAGELEGRELDVLPASMTTWERFREAHPTGVVLAAPGGESEVASEGDAPAPIDEYDPGPYDAYFEAGGFGLDAHRGTGDGREWERDDLDPKAVVVGLERGGEALGFPLPIVERGGGVATASVGSGDGRDPDVVVFATRDGVHAFENPGIEFRPRDGGDGERTADGARDGPVWGFVGDGTVWEGATGRSRDGRELTRLPARRLFAFAWQDDHGSDAFYGLDGRTPSE